MEAGFGACCLLPLALFVVLSVAVIPLVVIGGTSAEVVSENGAAGFLVIAFLLVAPFVIAKLHNRSRRRRESERRYH
jgi:hypothetical protein